MTLSKRKIFIVLLIFFLALIFAEHLKIHQKIKEIPIFKIQKASAYVPGCPLNCHFPPVVNISPKKQVGRPGDTFTFTITVKNKDSSSCPESCVGFHLLECPPGWSCVNNFPLFTFLKPGESITNTVQITSPRKSPHTTKGFMFEVDSSILAYWRQCSFIERAVFFCEVCNDMCTVPGSTILGCDKNWVVEYECGYWGGSPCLEYGHKSYKQNCALNPSNCGYGTCNPDEKPSWYCSNGECKYSCIKSSECFSFLSSSCQPHNTYGWAWSENIGWISFSCENCNSNRDGITDTGNYSHCPSGEPISDYGVDICTGNSDQDPDRCSGKEPGTLVGYAWSENIGWISFNESDLTGCPQPPCKAWVDLHTGKVKGWAKALAAEDPQSGGWNGWIHLNGSNYEVKINSSVSPAEFEGWAWGGDVIGWISFNCDNPESGNVCAQSDYKVYTTFAFQTPPQVSDFKIEGTPEYCQASPNGVINFSWLYTDSNSPPKNQTEYQLQVATDSGFNHIVVDDTQAQIITSGNRGSTNVIVKLSPSRGREISYNDTYWARVRAKNENGDWSDWSNVISFSTPIHPYPQVDFNWDPEKPIQGEDTQFFNLSTTYNSTTASIFWQFEDATPSTSTEENPVVQFNDHGAKNVSLTITDSTGYTCTKDKTVNVQIPLPGWQEIPPE